MVGSPHTKPWAGVIVGVGLLLVLVLSCLGLGAIASAPRIGTRSKNWEARYNLKAAFSCEKSYFQEQGVYSETIGAMGFAPERANRYLIILSADGPLLLPGADDGGQFTGVLADEGRADRTVDNALLFAGIPAGLRAASGVKCEADGGCDVTIVAAGNIDDDPTVDVWSISTRDRVIGTESVPAGTPFNHVDDTRY